MMSLVLLSLGTLGKANFRAPRWTPSKPEKTYYKRSRLYDAPSTYSKQKPPSRLPDLALVSRLSPRHNIRLLVPMLDPSATISTAQPLAHRINDPLGNLTHGKGFSQWKILLSALTSATPSDDRLARLCVMRIGTRTFVTGSSSSPLLEYPRLLPLLPYQLSFRPLASLSRQLFKMPLCVDRCEKAYWRLVPSRGL